MADAPDRPRVRVAPAPGHEAAAAALAARLDLPLAPAPAGVDLVVDDAGLGLRRGTEPAAPLRVRLADARPGAEEVVRAVRGRRSLAATGLVVDATAGLGGDAAALARAGLRVVLVERHPVLHALLEDALARLAGSGDADDAALADRMRLLHGDAVELLATLRPAPGIVYLDPMYPEPRGGAKRRGMALVRDLLGEGAARGRDAVLLEAARRAARTRVVSKRPAKAPPLAPDVSGSVRGRTTRFDLYAPLPAAG